MDCQVCPLEDGIVGSMPDCGDVAESGAGVEGDIESPKAEVGEPPEFVVVLK